MSLELCPMTLREARAYVNEHHRHHRAPQGGLFAIGAATRELDSGGADQAMGEVAAGWYSRVVGVVIVGRPVARHNDDGWTCEVTRLASDGSKNVCSMLYRAAWRAGRAMGYHRLITYILDTEPGTSLKAAGFVCIGTTDGGSWSRVDRPRVDLHPTQPKLIWEVTA